MVKIIIGQDVYGHIKKFLVKIQVVKILDVILKVKMVEYTGFMVLFMILINI